jgi:hypothetical protein
MSKVRDMLYSLGYAQDATIMFTIKRLERLDPIHVNASGKEEEQIKEMFDLFHRRYGVRIIGGVFPSSSGSLQIDTLIEFLEEYDEKFNLDWCEIDFKELIVKPIYL